MLHGQTITANVSLTQKFYHSIDVQQPLKFTSTCMQVLGAFVKLGHWLPLMVDSVAAPQASLPNRVNALVVLSAMLHAAGMPLPFCWPGPSIRSTKAHNSCCIQSSPTQLLHHLHDCMSASPLSEESLLALLVKLSLLQSYCLLCPSQRKQPACCSSW